MENGFFLNYTHRFLLSRELRHPENRSHHLRVGQNAVLATPGLAKACYDSMVPMVSIGFPETEFGRPKRLDPSPLLFLGSMVKKLWYLCSGKPFCRFTELFSYVLVLHFILTINPSELGVTVGSPTSRFRYHGGPTVCNTATCTDFETLGRAARAAPWSWALLGWWTKMGNLLGCFFNWDNGIMVNDLVIMIKYLDVWPFTMIIPNDCEFREFTMG